MRREWMIIAAVALMAAGCGHSVEIPNDARLLYYGYPPTGLTQPKGPGTYYLYDATDHKVVAAIRVGADDAPDLTGRRDHRYQVYFAPEGSATQPAVK